MTNKHAKALSALAAQGRKKIPPEKRREIAIKANTARWKGHTKQKRPTSH